MNDNSYNQNNKKLANKLLKFKKYALISVYNKKHLFILANSLYANGYNIIATEGSGKILSKHNIPFIPADKISRNPNYLKDCINTISFRIQAGILFNRASPNNIKDIFKLHIKAIDVVICNFVPFAELIKNPKTDFNIKNVDVGGPLMVRAAATNFKNVMVITDPNDYKKVSKTIAGNNNTLAFRKQFAIKAFKYISQYDNQLIKFLNNYKIN